MNNQTIAENRFVPVCFGVVTARAFVTVLICQLSVLKCMFIIIMFINMSDQKYLSTLKRSEIITNNIQ